MCISAAIFEYEDEDHFQRENSKEEDTDNVCHYSGLLSTESYGTDELKNKKWVYIINELW